MFAKIAWTFEEIKFLTLLALPTSIICLTEGIQLKMSNIFIGRVSGKDVSTELSALFIGQIVLTIFAYSISEGLSACVTILCSQAYGAGQHRLVKLYYYRVLILTILLCFPLFSMFVSIGSIVYLFTQSWELSIGAGSYTTIFCCGFPSYAYYQISISYLQSQNIVWSPLIYLMVGNISNGFLQYILIMHCNLGIAGAASAYVISTYIIALLIFTHIQLFHQNLPHVELSIDLISGWYNTAKFVIPTFLQTMIVVAFTRIIALIILLQIFNDESEFAIFSIMISVWYLYSLFTMGYSRALTVRVGQLLGANTVTKAKKSAIFGIAFGETVLLFICINAMLFYRQLCNLFTTDEKFLKELYINMLIQPVCILVSDTIILGQGVMNACGLQHTQTILKFVFLFVFGSVSDFIFVRYFTLKALVLFFILSVSNALAFVSSMTILFCRNWNTIAQNISYNTHMNDSIVEPQLTNRPTLLSHFPFPEFKFAKLELLLNSKLLIVLRYVICLLFGVFLFVVVKFMII
ncbi:Multidrug and toxin extrusion protein 1 [Oopsacas minuta]|uniref:Multidrug and toxin extrusion protein n=1 Tax=Oopsacas minuta TaxID=111878 RepID=A0AAV7JIG4_9METZ|nr:Multidrug and toxin extrusion protein 1 [Oopsacas minuta]